jgi:hypothetical protein
MVPEMSISKEGAVREQQHETQPFRNDGWMLSRPEAEASGFASHGSGVHRRDHR